MGREYTEAKAKYMNEYYQKNTRKIVMTLNYNSDADILQKLGQVKSMQGYIKNLIREDIRSK